MWVLLHGFTGAPASWDTVVRVGRLETPPMRPWLAGHGPRVEGSTSFADEVAGLLKKVAEHPPPRLLAGYSLGARVALGMMAAAPDLFVAGLLIGLHPGLPDAGAREARALDDKRRANRLRAAGLEAFVDEWEREPLFATQQALSPESLAAQRTIRLGHRAEGLARSLDVLGLAQMPNYAEVLPTLPMHLTLMAGSRDSKFVEQATRFASPRHCVSIVEGAGHNLVLERPEKVAGAMAELEQVSNG